MPLEMVSCGKCKRCLGGGRVHGPYPYHWVTDASGRRRHRYWMPGMQGARDVPADVRDEMRSAANWEADSLRDGLTDEQRARIDALARLNAETTYLKRRHDAEMDAAVAAAVKRGDESEAVMAMTDDMAARHGVELSRLKDRFAGERERLWADLGMGKNKKQGGGREDGKPRKQSAAKRDDGVRETTVVIRHRPVEKDADGKLQLLPEQDVEVPVWSLGQVAVRESLHNEGPGWSLRTAATDSRITTVATKEEALALQRVMVEADVE